jgi:cytidylate kinase
MAKLIVTLDGPAASGKSTVARLVAERLRAVFLDTGATYRAATWAALQAGVALEDIDAVHDVVARTRIELCGQSVWVDGREVTAAIRTPALTAEVRHLANAGVIRTLLVDWQRAFADRYDCVVTEGRDQGTVVFPEAQVKIFLTASPRERARRRRVELTARGLDCDVERIEADLIARDQSDRNRDVAPLEPAPDAIEVDTTGMSIDQVVDKVAGIVEREMGGGVSSNQ